MSMHHDPELDDVLQDQELLHLAGLLSTARLAAPPLDEAFRSGLRRQLMKTAWEMGERRPFLWRRGSGSGSGRPLLAWAGAAAGLVLIASVVVYMANQTPGGFTQQLLIYSSMDGGKAVRLEQPILVAFNQPMDHTSTEAAVQITPATSVSYSWTNNTLAIQPTSGNLAPNTQYQVTIGPSAKTTAGQTLANPHPITFVTQPPPSPTPSPSPTARPSSPGSLLTDERRLANLAGGITATAQWSADSSTIYFVNAMGALELVAAKGGDVTIVVPDGVSSPAMAPAGDRLAYIRGGKIEVLTFAAGKTSEVTVTPAATLVGWVNDKLVWATGDGLYTQGADAPTRIAPLPKEGNVSVVSIAPDGAHAVLQQDQKLLLLDLATARSSQLGASGAHFFGWSPGGTHLLYSSADAVVVADVQGITAGKIPGGEPSWSTQDAILLGSDTDLYQVRPDASAIAKLANGTYHAPLWAPNGTAFAFFRSGAIWTASAPPLPPQPTTLDKAAIVVNSFMQARLKLQRDQAMTYLDDNGKQAYSTGGLNLIINPGFSRSYILAQEVTGAQAVSARFVVRIVLSNGKLDVSEFEETLTLQRDPASKQFVIDQATASGHRDLGKGAEVVAVDVAADNIKVTFDSDLDSSTVSDGVQVLDSNGKPVEGSSTYANRTVTISGLNLKPGSQYRLVVLASVRDYRGNAVASEYDLQLLGPAAQNRVVQKNPVKSSPSPVATPSPTS